MSDESEKGAVRIIEHTISNGWSGFVAPKENKVNGIKETKLEPTKSAYAEMADRLRKEMYG